MAPARGSRPRVKVSAPHGHPGRSCCTKKAQQGVRHLTTARLRMQAPTHLRPTDAESMLQYSMVQDGPLVEQDGPLRWRARTGHFTTTTHRLRKLIDPHDAVFICRAVRLSVTSTCYIHNGLALSCMRQVQVTACCSEYICSQCGIARHRFRHRCPGSSVFCLAF